MIIKIGVTNKNGTTAEVRCHVESGRVGVVLNDADTGAFLASGNDIAQAANQLRRYLREVDIEVLKGG